MTIDHSDKIAALEAAAASGLLTIESEGDRQTYRSMSDLLAALAYFRNQQASGTPTISRPASTVAVFDPR
ncbi:hypothetical protein SAMN05192583_0881 [Sphingomonas gellani]|uniref:GpW protein n=1 Tax=Sphingomonas gellani TaxID=1166340 RepID=A0A1H7ZYT3_9SPHN|nr:hypothetical protein [Sphingomonas gellani]SEM62659.1 hypothetical protein SAMN05192583_0881 [Sphingomonas gellani]